MGTCRVARDERRGAARAQPTSHDPAGRGCSSSRRDRGSHRNGERRGSLRPCSDHVLDGADDGRQSQGGATPAHKAKHKLCVGSRRREHRGGSNLES
eukprot:6945839-Prymnesium_polylepis.1